MQLWIPQNETDLVVVRRVLDQAEVAAKLGHVVTAQYGFAGLHLEVSEGALPLRQCTRRPQNKVRDSRLELCYCGGDEDGHTLEPSS